MDWRSRIEVANFDRVTFARSGGVLLALLLLAPSADAEPTRVALAVTGSPIPFGAYVFEHRLGSRGASAVSPWPVGVEGSFKFHGPHGASLGALFAYNGIVDLFSAGPAVIFFDAAYSFEPWAPKDLRGFKPALGIRLGPSFAVVQRTYYPSDPDVFGAPPTGRVDVPTHLVIGPRASLVLDLHIWNALIGIEAGYRGGVPVGVPFTNWEGAIVLMFRVGLVMDVGR